MADARLRVLIVSYHFPPDAAVGGIRPAKFAKYLKAEGCDVRILTVSAGEGAHCDRSRNDDVRDIVIHRSAARPTVVKRMIRWRERLFGGAKSPRADNSAGTATAVGMAAETEGGRSKGFFYHVKRLLISVFEFPDRHAGWLWPAVRQGVEIVRDQQTDVILASSPPGTTALVGLLVAKRTSTPLITDLRDPLFMPELKHPMARSKLSDIAEHWLRLVVFRSSRAVITTTPEYRDYLRTEYPSLPQGLFETIANGFDAQDYVGLEAPRSDGPFVVSYVGTFYLGRSPKEFLAAVARLVEAGTIPKEDIRIVFAGRVEEAEGERVSDMVERCGLNGCTELMKPVPYRDALRIMANSDALLLFAPAQPFCIPAKAYEYMGFRKPILCFSGPGATSNLITRTGAGLVVDQSSVDGIEEALARMYRAFKAGHTDTGGVDLSRYSRAGQARELLQLADRVLPGGASTRTT